ncbi:hypothetical protein [Bradyrhizobium sp. 45]|uniref:hypothetical protein n=1 Tax=Bradyrhizobium sp. 45 TaxID=1043587 RepID=UPI001FF7D640|nr:hypothetical protein [Bradyrhizobium sp. 45]MCK1305791.1 hypothetical protein [Bradyrhizobium sp. 45]
MSQLGLNSALWAIYTSGERAELLKINPDALITEFELTEDERQAVATLDLRGLLQAGAHPFLMYKAVLRTSGPMTFEKLREYVKKLEGLQLRDIVT